MKMKKGQHTPKGQYGHKDTYKTGGPVRQHYKLATTGKLGQEGGKINGGKTTPA